MLRLLILILLVQPDGEEEHCDFVKIIEYYTHTHVLRTSNYIGFVMGVYVYGALHHYVTRC